MSDPQDPLLNVRFTRLKGTSKTIHLAPSQGRGHLHSLPDTASGLGHEPSLTGMPGPAHCFPLCWTDLQKLRIIFLS